MSLFLKQKTPRKTDRRSVITPEITAVQSAAASGAGEAMEDAQLTSQYRSSCSLPPVKIPDKESRDGRKISRQKLSATAPPLLRKSMAINMQTPE